VVCSLKETLVLCESCLMNGLFLVFDEGGRKSGPVSRSASCKSQLERGTGGRVATGAGSPSLSAQRAPGGTLNLAFKHNELEEEQMVALPLFKQSNSITNSQLQSTN